MKLSHKDLFLLGTILAVSFITINPESGRDYFSYHEIIERVYDNRLSFLKEYLFYFYVKISQHLGFSPAIVIWQLRFLFFILFLRFGREFSKNKSFFILFFFLVPNIFLGSLNALQTWLSISIGVFIINRRNSLKKDLFLLLLSTGFHIFGIFYIPLIFLKRISKSLLKKILILSLPLTIISTEFLLLLISKIGLSKYLFFESISIKGIIVGAIFLSINLFASYLTKNRIFTTYSILCIILITSIYKFKVDDEIALRSINYLIPFGWLALDSIFEQLKQKKEVQFLLFILLLLNLLITIDPKSDKLW